MFVQVGTQVKVEDLIRGMIVQSGNDACIVLAEAIAGSEEQFAALMNQKAKELGLSNTNFKNSTGWPDPEQHMCCRDIATLAGASSRISRNTITTTRRRLSSITASSKGTATRWCRRARRTG